MLRARIISLAFFLAVPAVAQDVSPGVTFNIVAGQLVSRGQHLKVHIPGAHNAAFFLQPARKKPVFLGIDDGSHPPPAYAPGCPNPPCLASEDFQQRIGGSKVNDVPDGPAEIVVVSPIGSGQVAGRRSVFYAEHPPRATFRQPAFGEVIPARGVKVVARTNNPDVVEIKVEVVTPFQSHCAETDPDVPAFNQQWLGDALGYGGSASCAPTSTGALFQYIQNNNLGFTVPSSFSGCAQVADCGVAMATSYHRCLVTALGIEMDTNGIVSGDGHAGSGGQIFEGATQFLESYMSLTRSLDYQSNDDIADGIPNAGWDPETLVEAYYAGGPYVLGFSNIPGDPSVGHYVVVNNVSLNSDGTADLDIMDPYANTGDSAPACGIYQTLHADLNGVAPYTLLFDNNATTHIGLNEIVYFRNFNARPDGCGGRAVPVAGKMINLKWWEGHYTPTSSGPQLLVSTSTDRFGHVQKDYQYVVVSGAR